MERSKRETDEALIAETSVRRSFSIIRSSIMSLLITVATIALLALSFYLVFKVVFWVAMTVWARRVSNAIKDGRIELSDGEDPPKGN
jgi:hypothetical protein